MSAKFNIRGYLYEKSITITISLLVSAIILSGVCFALLSTKKYIGTVVSSNFVDDHIELTIIDEKTNEQITILADEHTNVHNFHLEGDIYLGDLLNHVGSTVEVTCKRFFNQNHYSETIVVQLVHESGNGDS